MQSFAVKTTASEILYVAIFLIAPTVSLSSKNFTMLCSVYFKLGYSTDVLQVSTILFYLYTWYIFLF